MDRVARYAGGENGALGRVHPAVGTAEVDVVVGDAGDELAQRVDVREIRRRLGQPRVAIRDARADRVEDPGAT